MTDEKLPPHLVPPSWAQRLAHRLSEGNPGLWSPEHRGGNVWVVRWENARKDAWVDVVPSSEDFHPNRTLWDAAVWTDANPDEPALVLSAVSSRFLSRHLSTY